MPAVAARRPITAPIGKPASPCSLLLWLCDPANLKTLQTRVQELDTKFSQNFWRAACNDRYASRSWALVAPRSRARSIDWASRSASSDE